MVTVWLQAFQTPFFYCDSLVMDWGSIFFTRCVPGLTIIICNKITVSSTTRSPTIIIENNEQTFLSRSINSQFPFT